MKKDLKRLLENGDTIELKGDHALASTSLESSLSEVISDRKIRVRTKKKDLAHPINKQHQFILTTKKDKGLFQMQATVQEIVDNGSEVTLLLDVHTHIEQIQRREFFRLPLLKEITVNLVGDPPLKGLTQNISAGGIKCLVPSEIRSGATIDVYLELEPTPLFLKGRVLECEPTANNYNHTILRIQFIELSSKEQQALTAFILLQQGKREARVKR